MNITIAQKIDAKIDGERARKLAAELNFDSKFVELLFTRGLDSAEKIKNFLYFDKRLFHDPFLMKGMREAVDRIRMAVENRERVVIYGDYDADGICAAAILSLFLSSKGLDVCVHIPNRIGEGYGLNVTSLEKIIEDIAPDLLITCDCGISGAKEVEFALDLGVDVIVTDHHEISGEIPSCTVVNPKQNNCTYPYNMLCGAGVALKLVQAMDGLDAMLEFIDLACIATVADLVPLLDENRLIVQLGLKKLNERKNAGLSVMFDRLKLQALTASDIAYKIAPRINAAGRMGDAYRAFRLITSTDRIEINRIVDEIETDNARRKELCDEMFGEAVGDLAFEDLTNERAIVLSHPSWEKGITGIVAARLAGEYNRPSFILVKSGDNTYKGTCRSVEGINIHELLSSCRDLLIEFGGHSQAAGFSICPDKVAEFKMRVNDYLAGFDESYFLPKVTYDMEITEADINHGFVRALELLEPFGNSNPRPLFKISANELKIAPCKNPVHIMITLPSGIQLFAFNYSHLSYQLMSCGEKTLIAELQSSTMGGGQVKGIMRACSPSALYVNDTCANEYKYGLLRYPQSGEAKYTLYNDDDLDELTNKLYGTLIVADNRDTFEQFIEKHSQPIFCEYMYATNRNNFSRIIVAPEFDDPMLSLNNYERIIFLFVPINGCIVSHINKISHAEVFLPEKASDVYEVNTDRQVFADYFECMRKCKLNSTSNVFAYWRHLNKNNSEISFRQLTFCLEVFAELGFITVTYSPFTIQFNSGVKRELNESVLYMSAVKGGERQ